MDLKTRLARSAYAWCEAWSEDGNAAAPYSRLSKRVVDDGKFFDNLAEMRRGPSTDTLEKFARFLIDPVNWPEGTAVPGEVEAFCHAVGISIPFVAHATGDLAAMSGPSAERERAA